MTIEMLKEKCGELEVEELDLSVRSLNCLKRAGINTVEDIFDVLEVGFKELRFIRNLGRVCTKEVMNKINDFGYPSEEVLKEYLEEIQDDDKYYDDFLYWSDYLNKIIKENCQEKEEVEFEIEKLDLSDEVFKCLKDAEINTIQKFFIELDKGLKTIKKVCNNDELLLKQVLVAAKECGYPAEKEILNYLNKSEYNSKVNEEEIRCWENILEDIEETTVKNDLFYKKMGIANLIGMPDHVTENLNKNNIFTIEDLFKRYGSEMNLPLSQDEKWEFVKILDNNGYRFKNCPKEEWPDIDWFILTKRAKNTPVNSLYLPKELCNKLYNKNITVVKLISEDLKHLKKEISDENDIAVLLLELDKHGFRIKGMSKEECPDIEEYIEDNLVNPILEENLSSKVFCRLIKNKIITLGKLKKYSRDDLIDKKIVDEVFIKEIVDMLQEKKMHLKHDAFYNCSRCGKVFADNVDNLEHICPICIEKIKNIGMIKDFSVVLEGPHYIKTENGTDGFIVYATIHNETKNVEKIDLSEFLLYHEYRQWSANSYLNGYEFDVEDIVPYSCKTVAKMWCGKDWENEKIYRGNYITVSFYAKGKKHTYKFVYRNNMFELDDYYSYKKSAH